MLHTFFMFIHRQEPAEKHQNYGWENHTDSNQPHSLLMARIIYELLDKHININ